MSFTEQKFPSEQVYNGSLKIHMFFFTCANLSSSLMGPFSRDSYNSRQTEEISPGASRVCCLRAGKGVPDGNTTRNLSAPNWSTAWKDEKSLEEVLLIYGRSVSDRRKKGSATGQSFNKLWVEKPWNGQIVEGDSGRNLYFVLICDTMTQDCALVPWRKPNNIHPP